MDTLTRAKKLFNLNNKNLRVAYENKLKTGKPPEYVVVYRDAGFSDDIRFEDIESDILTKLSSPKSETYTPDFLLLSSLAKDTLQFYFKIHETDHSELEKELDDFEQNGIPLPAKKYISEAILAYKFLNFYYQRVEKYLDITGGNPESGQLVIEVNPNDKEEALSIFESALVGLKEVPKSKLIEDVLLIGIKKENSVNEISGLQLSVNESELIRILKKARRKFGWGPKTRLPLSIFFSHQKRKKYDPDDSIYFNQGNLYKKL